MARYKPNLNYALANLIEHMNLFMTGTYTWRVKAVRASNGTVVTTNVTNHSYNGVNFWQTLIGTNDTIRYNTTHPTIEIASSGANGTINGIEITLQKTVAGNGVAAYAESVFARGTFSPPFDFAANYTLEVTSLELDFYSGDPMS